METAESTVARFVSPGWYGGADVAMRECSQTFSFPYRSPSRELRGDVTCCVPCSGIFVSVFVIFRCVVVFIYLSSCAFIVLLLEIFLIYIGIVATSTSYDASRTYRQQRDGTMHRSLQQDDVWFARSFCSHRKRCSRLQLDRTTEFLVRIVNNPVAVKRQRDTVIDIHMYMYVYVYMYK